MSGKLRILSEQLGASTPGGIPHHGDGPGGVYPLFQAAFHSHPYSGLQMEITLKEHEDEIREEYNVPTPPTDNYSITSSSAVWLSNGEHRQRIDHVDGRILLGLIKGLENIGIRINGKSLTCGWVY